VCFMLNKSKTYTGHVDEEVVEELPDVVGGVDLLHLHLCVHIAVVHKVHIGRLHLGNRQGITDMIT